MPELPEVETVRRGLEAAAKGRVVTGIELRRRDLRFPFPHDMPERLAGRTILAVRRRAKYLLVELSGGQVLLVHLGMSGRMTVARGMRAHRLGEYAHETGGSQRHDHAIFTLSGGTRLVYNDPRRFGFILLLGEGEVASHPLLARLGVEPLDAGLGAPLLARLAAGKRCDLKSFLMDQRIVAGLGNIYVCEALFRAGLSPARKAATLARRDGTPSERAEKLVHAIRDVLEEAIAAGGSTLKDYRDATGSAGAFQDRFFVYGRDGEPCMKPGCRGIVQRTIRGGRSTYFCPSCQR